MVLPANEGVNLANWLKTERESLQISQSQLSLLVGISQSRLSLLENGKARMFAIEYVALNTYFHLSKQFYKKDGE